MKSANRKIQIILFIFLIAGIAFHLVEGDTNFYPILMVWALPVGFFQYFGSLLDIVLEGKASNHLWHFGLSNVILLILFDVLPFNSLDTIAWYGTVPLAIYFWTLVFFKRDTIVEQEHNVYDL